MRCRPTPTKRTWPLGPHLLDDCRDVLVLSAVAARPTNSTIATRTASQSNWKQLVGSEQGIYVLETSDGRYHLVPRDCGGKTRRVRRAGRPGRPGDGGSLGTGVHRRAFPELPARAVGIGLILGCRCPKHPKGLPKRSCGRFRVHEERRGRFCATPAMRGWKHRRPPIPWSC